jgi:hypothetical protein
MRVIVDNGPNREEFDFPEGTTVVWGKPDIPTGMLAFETPDGKRNFFNVGVVTAILALASVKKKR